MQRSCVVLPATSRMQRQLLRGCGAQPPPWLAGAWRSQLLAPRQPERHRATRVEAKASTKAATEPTGLAKYKSLAAWIASAGVFGAGVWAVEGAQRGEEFFAGYLLEQSLSIDNLFVFILVFNYFKTPPASQSKVLGYGIATAAVLRLAMILLGVELIEKFEPILAVFAAILLYSAYQILSGDEEEDEDLEQNPILRACSSVLKVSDKYDGDKFFTVENGVKVGTPLLLTLAVIELSDVVFAVDSIPAVFGVTRDPFVVYTSNMFAILSLRSLYGFVSGAMLDLKYLDKAVALVLGFIGAKMLGEFADVHVPTDVSLLVVGTLLAGGVAASLLLPGGEGEEGAK